MSAHTFESLHTAVASLFSEFEATSPSDVLRKLGHEVCVQLERLYRACPLSESDTAKVTPPLLRLANSHHHSLLHVHPALCELTTRCATSLSLSAENPERICSLLAECSDHRSQLWYVHTASASLSNEACAYSAYFTQSFITDVLPRLIKESSPPTPTPASSSSSSSAASSKPVLSWLVDSDEDDESDSSDTDEQTTTHSSSSCLAELSSPPHSNLYASNELLHALCRLVDLLVARSSGVPSLRDFVADLRASGTVQAFRELLKQPNLRYPNAGLCCRVLMLLHRLCGAPSMIRDLLEVCAVRNLGLQLANHPPLSFPARTALNYHDSEMYEICEVAHLMRCCLDAVVMLKQSPTTLLLDTGLLLAACVLYKQAMANPDESHQSHAITYRMVLLHAIVKEEAWAARCPPDKPNYDRPCAALLVSECYELLVNGPIIAPAQFTAKHALTLLGAISDSSSSLTKRAR